MNGQPVVQSHAVTMDYGHDGAKVAVIFSNAVQNLRLTIPETDAMIASLEVAKAKLAEHLEAAVPARG